MSFFLCLREPTKKEKLKKWGGSSRPSRPACDGLEPVCCLRLAWLLSFSCNSLSPRHSACLMKVLSLRAAASFTFQVPKALSKAFKVPGTKGDWNVHPSEATVSQASMLGAQWSSSQSHAHEVISYNSQTQHQHTVVRTNLKFRSTRVALVAYVAVAVRGSVVVVSNHR